LPLNGAEVSVRARESLAFIWAEVKIYNPPWDGAIKELFIDASLANEDSDIDEADGHEG
jgi:hypothetical protein